MTEKKVLVIEDNALNLKLARCLLQIAQFGVLEAVDAESGIETALRERPDLILMDLQLPGMDGLTATRKLKGMPETEAIPIVALSSYAMTADKHAAMEAGCRGYLTKPIDTKTFATLVSGFLEPVKKETVSEPVPRKIFHHTVLIVEDDDQTAKLLEAMLRTKEYRTRIAYSGRDALEMVSESVPDLIIIDILMPGMDGYELTRRLKSEPLTEHIPIIMISSLNGVEDKLRGMEAGTDEFLNKPIQREELLTRVKSLLRTKVYREQLNGRKMAAEHLIASRDETDGVRRPSNSAPHVLIVEDSDKDVVLIKSQLEKHNYQFTTVNNGEDALSICFVRPVDIVLLDLILPGIDGYAVCRQLKNDLRTRHIQVLMITGVDDFQSRLKSVESGADDYLIKPVQQVELTVRVQALLKKKVYLDQLISNADAAFHNAITDEISGLFNFSYFKYFVDMELERCKRQGQNLSLISMYIELKGDHEKASGLDRLHSHLGALGAIIRKSVRKIDLAARTGDNRFSVILLYSDRNYAAAVVNRLTSLIHEPSTDVSSETTPEFRIGFGISSYPIDGKTLAELMAKADLARSKT